MSDITVDQRDAFEKVFPPPKHVIRCGKGYACTEYNAWGAHNFIRQWEGWSAAMLHGRAEQQQSEQQNIPENIPGGNSPVIPDDWIAAVNRLLDSDGSRGCYHAIELAEARAELEQLLSAQQAGSVSN
ncbi:hypothetical protein ACUMLB_003448 [Escherichia coli]